MEPDMKPPDRPQEGCSLINIRKWKKVFNLKG